MAKLPESVRGKLALMRARAKLSGGAKKKGGGRRRSGGGGRGFLGITSFGNGGSMFELASVGVLGAVGLGAFFRLPVWLSPVGAALYLYGMWRGNGAIKTLGLLLIALGLVNALGVPQAIAAKVEQAKANGLIPMLGAGSVAPASSSNGGGGGSNDIGRVLDNAQEVAATVGAFRTAFA